MYFHNKKPRPRERGGREKSHMKITPQMLRDKNACEEKLEVFEREWPDGVEVTEASILRMFELGFDVFWGVKQFLFPPAEKAFWKAYEEAIATAIIEAIAMQESTTPPA